MSTYIKTIQDKNGNDIFPRTTLDAVGGIAGELVYLNGDYTTVPNSDGCVHYDRAQELTDLQKAQARTNIGAADILMSGVTYFISSSGSDDNDGLTTSTPFATFEHALSLIPKNLNGNTVNLIPNFASGTNQISEVIKVWNYYGGIINIGSDTTYSSYYWALHGTLSIDSVGATVYIRNCNSYTLPSTSNISISCCSAIQFRCSSSVTANATGGARYPVFIGVYSGSIRWVTGNLTINNYYKAIETQQNGFFSMYDEPTITIANTNTVGIRALGGVSCLVSSHFTNNASTKYVYDGGLVIKGSTLNPTT